MDHNKPFDYVAELAALSEWNFKRQARIEALEAELVAARKDGERLDWLESLQLHEGIFGHSMQGRDLLCRSGDWTCGNNVLGGWFNGKTPRAAIDAARAAEGGKG